MSMAGYTKLFNSILASTIWEEDDKTRIVWITLLAMADKFGVADGSVPGIATLARVTQPDCQKALAKLQAPDKDSRSDEYEGRRIRKIDGGWLILNHEKYRAKIDDDERREYLRVKKAESRRRLAAGVNTSQQPSKKSTQAEAEAEPETRTESDQTQTLKNARPPKPNAQSKRPVYTSDRFAVFEWQLDELSKMLGAHFEAFGLDEFFDNLSQQSRASGLVIPRADMWPWLQNEVMAEVKRRKLPIASAVVSPAEDRKARERAQDERILAEIQQERITRAGR